MRRVTRLPLDPPVQVDLDNRQAAVNQRRPENGPGSIRHGRRQSDRDYV